MFDQALTQLAEFTSTTLATTIALALVAAAVFVIRRFWRGPIDPSSLFEWIASSGKKRELRIEYRDAVGALLDLGPRVDGVLKTVGGGSLFLVGGHFVGEPPHRVTVGAQCTITVADALIVEPVRIRVDLSRDALYVTSKYTKGEVLAQINGYGAAATL